ncbi:MAG: DUF937 domain-containing protein [Deltaproteobacteria bacterium]|nr:DUF937 domain-containing protein [Deltaproteobacteria bacterium]
MGLFDEFAKQVAKAAQAFAENTNPELASGILEMLQQRGGLDALVRRFQEQGLGDVIASWVSTGPNRRITPEDLAKILDPEQLVELSRRAGIAMSRLPEALAGLMPTIVDRLTPDGEMPDPYRLLRMVAGLFRSDRAPS